MSTCIYCGVEGTGVSAEHILQESLGSSWKSKRILCQTCNNLFGRTIDDTLAKEMTFFRNYLSIMGKDGVIPNIELKTKSGESFTRNGSGDYILKERPEINESLNDVGELSSIQVKAQVIQTEKVIKDIEKGLSRRGYTAASMSAHGYSTESLGNTPVRIKFSLSSFVALRKSLINYWAMTLGMNESAALKIEANKIYKFAKLLENKTVTTEQSVDYAKKLDIAGAPLLLTIQEETKNKFTENNSIAHTLLLSCKDGILFGGISLFGSIQWGFKLYDKYENDGIWITTINPIVKERVIKSNKLICSTFDSFKFRSVLEEKYFEILQKQFNEAVQHCLEMEHLTSIKEIMETKKLEKYFPITDIDSIENIFLERASLIFGYIFAKYDVTPHIFRTELGMPFIHEAVSSYITEQNIKELNMDTYNVFISGCFKIAECMAKTMPFLVELLQAETNKVMSLLFVDE